MARDEILDKKCPELTIGECFIVANFKARDVSDRVDSFRNLLRRCNIPPSSFGIGEGAFDHWNSCGSKAAFEKAKGIFQYNSHFQPDQTGAATRKTYARKLNLNQVEMDVYLQQKNEVRC